MNIRTKIKTPIQILILGLLVLSCANKSQENFFDSLKSEFQDSIENNNAKSFEYHYDRLSPQESFFINCKLKYLKLISNGELTTQTELVYFDNNNINKIVKRIIIYEGNDNGETAGRNWNKIEDDTIFIYDFNKKTKSKIVNGKLFNQSTDFEKYGNYDYLIQLKKETERNYNCR